MPRYDTVQYPDLKEARDTLRLELRCINGPRDAGTNVGKRGVVHGPVVKSGKCQRCVDVAYKKPERASGKRIVIMTELDAPGLVLVPSMSVSIEAA